MAITQSIPVPPRPDPTLDLERLRTPTTVYIMLGAILLWMLYIVSSFRLPTQPITLSDADSGAKIRQLVFTATGMLAFMRLVLTRSLASALSLRFSMTALTGLLIFSALWSDLPSLTIKRSIIFLFGMLGLIVIVHSSKRPIHLMLRTVVYFTAAVSSISLLFYFTLPHIYTVNPARPGLAGISNHPNTLAPFLSIGLLLSFGLRAKLKKEIRLLRFSQCALAIGLILTFSMTTILTTLLGVAIFSFLSAKNYRRGLMQVVMVGGAILITIIGLDNLKGMFFSATGRDESLSGRDQLWSMVLIEYKKNPAIGRGFGAFWTEGKGRDLVQTWNPRQSHNAYLDVMLDLGAVGLIAVLFIFPLKLLLIWNTVSGKPGSDLRMASSSMMAVAFSYMLVYSAAQSFFLRFDVFPFLIVAWIVLLLTNPDRNNLSSEFLLSTNHENSRLS